MIIRYIVDGTIIVDSLRCVLKDAIQRFREIESIAANLGTAIEYENPIDHKCHSAYYIGRNAFELIEQWEVILSEMTSEN